MKKSILFLALAVLSITAFSFKPVDNSKVLRLPGGNFLSSCAPITPADAIRLGEITVVGGSNSTQMAGLIIVRCEHSCECQFTRSVAIAGRNCGGCRPSSPQFKITPGEQAAVAEAERIMTKYLTN